MFETRSGIQMASNLSPVFHLTNLKPDRKVRFSDIPGIHVFVVV